MNLNLLPALEAYVTQRISDIARRGQPGAAERIEELEMVRTVCRGLAAQFELITPSLERPCNKP